jgi:putative heme-binding domain-containing protein
LEILLVLRDWPDLVARRTISAFLDDPDAAIRFAAIEWIGDQKLTEFRELLLAGLSKGAVTRQLFEAYLAALERLEGTTRSPKEEFPGEDYVARLVADPAANAVVRRRALRALRPDHPVLTMALLNKLLAAPDLAMRLEAVRTLRESPHSERIALLASLAGNAHEPPALRAEAIAGLSGETDESRALLVSLGLDADPDVRHEALRSLRGAALSAEQRARLAQGAPDDASRALVAFLADPPNAPSQASNANIDAWLQRIDDHASAAEGERIFFHPKGPGCFRCHQVDGRGGRGGPDLSTTGQVLELRRLVESILQPSKEIAPQFVAWLIAKKDGTVVNGVLLSETPEGDQTYADAQGHAFTLSASQIEDRKPLATSLMPDDLAKTLTPQEFSALIAFLRHPRREEAQAPEASNGGARDSASP